MASPLMVPKMGLTMTKGVVTEWLIADGADVNVGDVVYILTTDKTDAEIEADASGTLHRVSAIGDTVIPGEAVGYLLAPGEVPPTGVVAALDAVAAVGVVGAPVAAAAPVAATPVVPALADGARQFVSPNARRVATEVGVDVSRVVGTGPNGRVITADVLSAATASPPAGPASASSVASSSAVSPLAARLAAQLGVDLSGIVARGGRIRLDDVVAAARTSAPTATPKTLPSGPRPGDVVRHSSMRRAIAARMHESLQQTAQLTLTRDADAKRLVKLRDELKTAWPQRDWAVPTFNDLVIKAVAVALGEHPRLNASFTPDALVVHDRVDIGTAVALDDGLVVPVIRDADQLPLRTLAAVSSSLAARARAGQLGPDDYSGQTFTVSALGSYGIDAFTPVLNSPNVAILGVGAIRDRVGWKGDKPKRLPTLTLSLTIDHRAVDGVPGAAFLATVAEVLASPAVLLA